eukprot:gnl/Trimastix_PCT/4255.p1 GENE.gnl/Trimastix_PCT/4255~~gnl/Trimastix_PCT/4255.p1  ORF type:complete len:265 (-),score=23.80 gnl/Trimastix_PCT/4255:41-835(-)
MLLQILSDVHLEFRDGVFEFPAVAPNLALLGDTSTSSRKGIQFLYNWLQIQSPRFQHIFYICGNHEFFYGHITNSITAFRMLCERFPNVHFLEQESYLLDDHWRILGCTLWSHVPDKYLTNVEQRWNDFRLIQSDGHAFSPQEATAIHTRSRAWLNREITAAHARGEEVLVLTHHGPVSNVIPFLSLAPKLQCMLATDLPRLLRAPVRAWFYGHTHWSRRLTRNSVQVISNQVGYPRHNRHKKQYDESYAWDSEAQPAKQCVIS